MLSINRSSLRIVPSRSSRGLISLLGAVVLASACAAPTTSPTAATPEMPEIAKPVIQEFVPPAHYALWWEMTKSCSGLDRDVSGIRFYAEPASALQPTDGSTASTAGEWDASTSSIKLIDAATSSPTVVRHEMLHALLVAGGHPADKFGRDCQGYVNCEAACAESLGDRPQVDVNAARVEVTDLEIAQRLVPAQIDLSKDAEGWFALVVEVHNPRPYAVRVNLQSFPGRPGVAATIGYAGDRVSHQEYVNGNTIALLPGETQRMVFDLRATDFVTENGSARIRGFFNSDSLPVQTLSVR